MIIEIDYKPKHFNIESIPIGNLQEFANIFAIEGAHIELPLTKISGVLGWKALLNQLVGVYLPHLKDTHFLSLIGSISGIKSVVTVGKDIKDFFVVPYTQYVESGELASGKYRIEYNLIIKD